jgi:hypothetical protein
MKKIGLLLSIIALILPTLPATAAQDVFVSVGVEDREVYQSSITKIGWVGVRNGLPYFDGNITCSSFDDSQCLELSHVGIIGTTILPLCTSDAELNCIEVPRFGNTPEARVEAQFLGNAEGFTFPADVAQGITRGSTSSIFSIVDRNDKIRYFVVTAMIRQLKARKSSGGYSDIQTPLFSVDIKEIRFDLKFNCLFIFKQSCVSHKSSESFEAEITIRLAKNPPKWLAGRIATPKVSFTTLRIGRKITILGSSVSIPIAEGSVPTSIFSKYPRGIPSASVLAAAENGTKLVIDPGIAIMYAKDVFAALNEKSTNVANYWNINGSSPITAFCAEDLQVDCLQGGNGPCVEDSKEFVGLLATNALIFNRNPPRLIDDEIQFILASPHLLPNSKEAIGNFTLEASSSMLRCIYGLPNLPLFAEIAVVNDAGIKKIATKSFSEKKGISYIAVNNFSFSVPKIKIKLYPANKRLTIKCVKGNVKKSVSGLKPVCPTGYKKAV